MKTVKMLSTFSEFINKLQVSFEDLENQAQIGYINGISKLFIEKPTRIRNS